MAKMNKLLNPINKKEHKNHFVVSAIILAAGQSKRMEGKFKLLLPLSRRNTMIENVIENVLGSEVDETILVLGYKAETVIRRISKKDIKIAINNKFKRGIGSSISTGVKRINKRADGIMFLLADQPFINSEIINLIIEKFRKTNKGIVYPVCDNVKGHPVIFSKKYLNELLMLENDIGAHAIIERNPADIIEVPVNSKLINIDIDTISDYEKYSCCVI